MALATSAAKPTFGLTKSSFALAQPTFGLTKSSFALAQPTFGLPERRAATSDKPKVGYAKRSDKS